MSVDIQYETIVSPQNEQTKNLVGKSTVHLQVRSIVLFRNKNSKSDVVGFSKTTLIEALT